MHTYTSGICKVTAMGTQSILCQVGLLSRPPLSLVGALKLKFYHPSLVTRSKYDPRAREASAWTPILFLLIQQGIPSNT